MADTTTPTTPPAQDLQINLDEAPKTEPTTWNLQPETNTSELDLDLDLNLPEAPKNDDRLKTEDQKNAEPVAEVKQEEVLQPIPEVKAEAIVPQGEIPVPIMEPIPELVTEVKQPEAKVEEVVEEKTEPSKVVEDEPIPATAPAELKEDMKIISELEWNKSAGGLAPEAIVAPQPAPVEASKTFDLDAMLGGPIMWMPQSGAPVIETAQSAPQATIEMPTPMQKVTDTSVPPVFTIPTITAFIPKNEGQVPVQAVSQITIPQKKNTSVKALMFVVLFVALGFTTFFILKTMYPIEFGNIFGGGQTQMHASEAVTGTELTGTELTGTELTGTELTGTTDTGTTVDNGFWELNDLTTTTTVPEQTDLSRLTDYVTQGNDFLAQGKTMNNNTVIKYGLYISKKATSFLEKIANGEQINNLSGYFAQFDQYITALKVLVGQTPNPDTTVNTPDQTVSTPSDTSNGLQDMTNTDTSTPTPDVTTQ